MGSCPGCLLTLGPGKPILYPNKGLLGALLWGPAPWKASITRCLFDSGSGVVLGRLGPEEKLVGIFPRHDEVGHGCLEQVLRAQEAFTSSADLDSSARQSVCLLSPA